eukprot:TRINITY_DN3402_c0_g1_i1.p3 TRINITY_DN3402_c0_g1~~TRINITY_DN3402_c0_g1_i1.p3  ORF type:complete len:109 (-),score=27.17 TRINITY_DN3402_c0_g1_i1:327-653(-)
MAMRKIMDVPNSMGWTEMLHREDKTNAEWKERWGTEYPPRPTTATTVASSRPTTAASTRTSEMEAIEKNASLLQMRAKLLSAICKIDEQLLAAEPIERNQRSQQSQWK